MYSRKPAAHRGHRPGLGPGSGRILLLLALLSSSSTTHAGIPAKDEVRHLLAGLRPFEASGRAAQRPRYSLSEDGYLRHLGAPPAHYFPVTGAVPGDPVQTALRFIEEQAALLGAIGPEVDFRPLRSREKGRRYYQRFSQTYAGLPIVGAEIIVQLDEVGGVRYLLSDIARDLSALDSGAVALRPRISPHNAVATALAAFAERGVTAVLRAGVPAIAIFDPAIMGLQGPVRLVWDLTVAGEQSTEVDERMLIDAHTGAVVWRVSLTKNALDREVYDAGNSSSIPGDLVRTEGDPASGLADADDTYAFLRDAYEFYANVHQRKSINDPLIGGGMTLSATVRFCGRDSDDCPWPNARWGGSRLYFGEGWASDDIVAHEYTHGVTDYESDLLYRDASGAINESFSDCWGEFIDRANGAGTDTLEARWKHGEDIASLTEDGGAGDGNPEGNLACGNSTDDDGDGSVDEGCPGSCRDGLDNGNDGAADLADRGCISRDLGDPPRKSRWYYSLEFIHPDRMSAYYERAAFEVEDDCDTCVGDLDGICEAGEDCTIHDHGGVHVNSGIGNKLCYLLTAGDRFNGYSVDAMGIAKIAGLYYEVNTNLLTRASDYADLGSALQQAAVNLSWTEAERNNVYRGLAAVEIAISGEDLFVDFRNQSGIEYGSSQFPFDTVAEGIEAASPGDRLIIRNGSYEEKVTFRRVMTVAAENGAAVIGRAP